jgi:arylformamidase
MRLVDLSLPIRSEMPHFEGTPPAYISQSHRLDDAGYRMSTVFFGSHTGTHLDAPAHFLPDGGPVDSVPLGHCIGEALVVDLGQKRAQEPITVDDVLQAAGDVVGGARLLIRTDWDERFGTQEYFSHYPPLAPDIAGWFAVQRVLLVGLDIPSLHPTEFAEMHRVMLSAGITIIESLANLRALTESRVFFSGLPISLSGADGAPVRAVAYDGIPHLPARE